MDLAASILEHEATIRLAIFAGLFSLLALAEALLPRRQRSTGRGWRWLTNWLLVLVDSLTLRLLLPLAAVGTALWAQSIGFGLFNWINMPIWLGILISFLFLDFAIYLQHVASHKIPILWRVHKVHHSDVDLDVTSALRFHPIEIILSMLYKMALVALIGAPAVAVVIFEVVLNGSAMFNHANLKLPLWLDNILRRFIVTPDMHRIHHSVLIRESDTNYGFNLSLWDRIFKTYTVDPEGGQLGMTIGLAETQNDKPTKPLWTFLFPFRRV